MPATVPIICATCEDNGRKSLLVAIPYICIAEDRRKTHLACPRCDCTDLFPNHARVSPPANKE